MILVHDYAGHPFQFQLSRQLAKLGNQVTHGYFAGDQGPKGHSSVATDDPDTFDIVAFDIDRKYSKDGYFSRRFNDLRYGKQVAKWILQNGPEFVVSGNCPTEAQEKVFQASEKVNAKFIPWVQDFYGVAVSAVLKKKHPFLGGPVSWYYQRLDKRHLDKSHANILISESFIPKLDEWGIKRDKNHVIPNWGTLSDISPGEKLNSWSREYALSNKFVFLYTGTLGIKHSPERILNLADEFKTNSEVVIVVAAQGRGFDWLQEQVKQRHVNNVRTLPLQPFVVFEDVLATADVTVALLESEAGAYAVPSKVLNYLCAGKPVLISSPLDNQAADIVARNKLGIAVCSNDEQAFCQASRQMYDDEDLRGHMSVQSRTYAEANFNVELIAKKFLKAIEK
jgi:glycosyltransferase involved in cell wall biosynthesis